MSVGVLFNARDWTQLGLNQQQIQMLDFLVRNASTVANGGSSIDYSQIIQEINETIESIALNYEKIPVQVSTYIDYITDGPVCVYAYAALTVLLNPTPQNGEKATVKRMGSGVVVVSGGGATIDGSATFSLMAQYGSYSFVYSQATGEWSIE